MHGDDGIPFVSLGLRLRGLDERLDHLERTLYDLDPQTSKRTLDTMTEIESVSRKNCNEMLRITEEAAGAIDGKLKVAKDMCDRSTTLVEHGIEKLKRKGDEERRETTRTIQELNDAVSVIDARVSAALLRTTATEQKCAELLGQAEERVNECKALKDEVALRCEQIETLLASLQSEGNVERYVASRREVIRESRSPSLRRSQVPQLISKAQSVAKLRTRSVDRSAWSDPAASTSAPSPAEFARVRASMDRSPGPGPDVSGWRSEGLAEFSKACTDELLRRTQGLYPEG